MQLGLIQFSVYTVRVYAVRVNSCVGCRSGVEGVRSGTLELPPQPEKVHHFGVKIQTLNPKS